jgi:hypothetical protein
VDVSLSDNESYLLELRDGRRAVWTMRVDGKKKAKRPTVEDHRFDLPKRLEAGSYELSIQPMKGDVATLGHAALF